MKTGLLVAQYALVLASFPVPAGAADPSAPLNLVAQRAPRELSNQELDTVTAAQEVNRQVIEAAIRREISPGQLRCEICEQATVDVVEAARRVIEQGEAERAAAERLIRDSTGTVNASGTFMRGGSFNR